jgi:hypothetical protein
MDVACLGCACGIPARRLVVYGGDQAVAIEHILGRRRVARAPKSDQWPMSARQIADLYTADTEKYAKVIREANIRLAE